MKKNEQKDAKIKRKNRIGEESKETRIRKIEKDGRGTVIEGVWGRGRGRQILSNQNLKTQISKKKKENCTKETKI